MLARSSYTTQPPNSQTSPVARSKHTRTTQWKAGSFVTRLSQVSLFQGAGWRVYCAANTHIRWHTHTHYLLFYYWPPRGICYTAQYDTKTQLPFTSKWKLRWLTCVIMVWVKHPLRRPAAQLKTHTSRCIITASGCFKSEWVSPRQNDWTLEWAMLKNDQKWPKQKQDDTHTNLFWTLL